MSSTRTEVNRHRALLYGHTVFVGLFRRWQLPIALVNVCGAREKSLLNNLLGFVLRGTHLAVPHE